MEKLDSVGIFYGKDEGCIYNVDLLANYCEQLFSKFLEKLHKNITQDICDNKRTRYKY